MSKDLCHRRALGENHIRTLFQMGNLARIVETGPEG